MRLTDFSTLTFDCYGTLIDWESGIYTGLQPLLKRMEVPLSRDAVLELFAEYESDQEVQTPDMVYSDLLTEVHRRLAQNFAIALPDDAHRRFGMSVPDWPAFADSASSLQYLKKYYKLVILSNVDRASFAGSNRRLAVDFDAVYTAQDIGSYKPNRGNFDYMLGQLGERGIDQARILHTAQSLFHDHAPAKQLGLTSAWIDRRHDQKGWGATMPVGQTDLYDFRFTSMAEMVRAHQDDLRS
jgi:2-haloalkanoic acid dehalogenase type II